MAALERPHPACASHVPGWNGRPRLAESSLIAYVIIASEEGGLVWETTDRGRAACSGWLRMVAQDRVYVKRL